MLSDLQNDRAAGSLILGPDGEVIHLSLYDKGQDPSQDEQGTFPQDLMFTNQHYSRMQPHRMTHCPSVRPSALQVLSAEGEKLPWVIVLQPEHTNTGLLSHTRMHGRLFLYWSI